MLITSFLKLVVGITRKIGTCSPKLTVNKHVIDVINPSQITLASFEGFLNGFKGYEAYGMASLGLLLHVMLHTPFRYQQWQVAS